MFHAPRVFLWWNHLHFVQMIVRFAHWFYWRRSLNHLQTDTFMYNVTHEKTRLFMAIVKNFFISAMQDTKKPPLTGWLD
jgi:hypothetical protein